MATLQGVRLDITTSAGGDTARLVYDGISHSTSDLIEITIQRGRSSVRDLAPVGSATITLDNTLRRYTPDGPLAFSAAWREGSDITIAAQIDSVSYSLFVGQIFSIESVVEGPVRTVICQAVEGKSALISSARSWPVTTDQAAGDTIDDLYEAVGLSSSASGGPTIPYFFLDAEPVHAGIAQLEESSGGRAFISRSGVGTYHGPSYRYGTELLTVDWDVDASSGGAGLLRAVKGFTRDSQIDLIRVSYTDRSPADSDTIWTQPDELYVQVPYGRTTTLIASFDHPVIGTPTGAPTYAAPGSTTVTMGAKWMRLDLVPRVLGLYPIPAGWPTYPDLDGGQVVLTGVLLTESAAQIAEAGDVAGARVLEISPRWLPSYTQAVRMADRLYFELSARIPTLSIVQQGLSSTWLRCLTAELDDYVRLRDGDGFDHYGFIGAISIAIRAGLTVETTWQVEPSRAAGSSGPIIGGTTPYLIIGDATYGQIGTGRIAPS